MVSQLWHSQPARAVADSVSDEPGSGPIWEM